MINFVKMACGEEKKNIVTFSGFSCGSFGVEELDLGTCRIQSIFARYLGNRLQLQ